MKKKNCKGSCARLHNAARGCTQGCQGGAQGWTGLHTAARGRARLHQDCTILHRVAGLRKGARMVHKAVTDPALQGPTCNFGALGPGLRALARGPGGLGPGPGPRGPGPGFRARGSWPWARAPGPRALGPGPEAPGLGPKALSLGPLGARDRGGVGLPVLAIS